MFSRLTEKSTRLSLSQAEESPLSVLSARLSLRWGSDEATGSVCSTVEDLVAELGLRLLLSAGRFTDRPESFSFVADEETSLDLLDMLGFACPL